MKRLALRLGILLASLVGALFALEHGLRATDVMGVCHYRDNEHYFRDAIEQKPGGPPERTGRIFQNRPDTDLRLKHFRFRTDALGLRTGPRAAPPGEGRMPILFLGDSVTLAWGVDDAESWVRRIEVEGRAADGRALRCMNTGHLMYDTVQEADLLRDWGPLLAPEVVVLTFVFNDVQPSYDQIEEMLAPPTADDGIPGEGSRLRRWFYAIRSLLRFRREMARIEELGIENVPPHTFYPSGWPRCAAALDDIRATCGELGARLVVFDDVPDEIPEVAAWCEANAVPRVAIAFTPGERELDVRNSAIDSHANARGNRLIAGKALAGLRSLGILAPD